MLKFKHNDINNLDCHKIEIFLNSFLHKKLKLFFEKNESFGYIVKDKIEFNLIHEHHMFNWINIARINFKLNNTIITKFNVLQTKIERYFKSLRFNKNKKFDDIIYEAHIYYDRIEKDGVKVNLHLYIHKEYFKTYLKQLTKQKLTQLINGKATT